nr:uncharacterized protein K02A2.6-like [Solanum lycopersicum]
MLLSEFDIVYVTQKAIKEQALVDHLIENPVDEEYKPLKKYFHDEKVSFVGEDISEIYLGWRLFFDGATNHQESIITDNGTNRNSQLMRDICEKFKITHRNSTAYHPQMNGVVKAANKNIKKIPRKMIDNHRGWHEMLPYALLGFRTTVITSIGATPYLLVYGTETVMPAEVEIPSLRIIQEDGVNIC